MRVTYTLLLATLCAAVGLSARAEGKLQVIKMSDIKWAPCDPKAPQPDPCQINYFRGNPEKEENYSFFRVPKGHTFPAHWHIHNENIIVTQGTLLIGGENDAKGTPVRAGEYLHVPAKFIYWATCAEQDCVVYLNNEGADSYIDVKELRPD